MEKRARLLEIGDFHGGPGARFSVEKGPGDRHRRTFIVPLTRDEVRALPVRLDGEVLITIRPAEAKE